MPGPCTEGSTATRRPLISAQPRRNDDAPTGLAARVLDVYVTIGQHRVRVLPEPRAMNRDRVEVDPFRVLRRDADTSSQALDLRVDVAGSDRVVDRADTPHTIPVRSLFPVVIEAPLTLGIPLLGERGCGFTGMRQRLSPVPVMRHSHVEFGRPRPRRTPRATACPRLPQESVTK